MLHFFDFSLFIKKAKRFDCFLKNILKKNKYRYCNINNFFKKLLFIF